MKNRFAIIDVETNGLPLWNRPADHPAQPRLVSYAIICCDEGMQPEPGRTYQTLIKPEGWTIPPDVTAVNGLTTERCESEGRSVESVLRHYTKVIEAGYVIAAFNAQFDLKIMRGELRRAGMDDLFERTPNTCVMRACDKLGIAKANGKRGWPKLSDVYHHFYQDKILDAHTAMADAQACYEIMVAMMAADLPLLPPAVHLAKDRS